MKLELELELELELQLIPTEQILYMLVKESYKETV